LHCVLESKENDMRSISKICATFLLLPSTTVLAIQALAARADIYGESRPIVEIANGKLQGVASSGMVYFKDIPYASPPVGELRWRPPQPAKDWEGMRDASQFGQACPQPLIRGLNSELVPGHEDCLKLNVYGPVGAKNLPVMVWFHGGGLLEGSATEPYYQPFALTKAGSVVVTVDYRLGTLGFFAPQVLAQEAEMNREPVGNYGTMDQIHSLVWVRDNIAQFGGDPNNVTIFGQSAGGRSVTTLMTSPAAKGLFHKAIAQSAQQLPMRQQKTDKFGLLDQESLDAKYIESLGVATMQELRALPVEKLIISPEAFRLGQFGGSFIDGEIIVGDALPIFAEGKQHKVPFIIGTNSWDASFFALGQTPVPAYVKKMSESPKIVENLYSDFTEKCVLTAQIMADGWYLGAVKQLADSANKQAPAYAYYYSYLTPNIRGTHIGAAHTFELPYVFGTQDIVLQAPSQPESVMDKCIKIDQAMADARADLWSAYWFPTTARDNEVDKSISDQMAASWVTFAKTGNPNFDGGTFWPRYDIHNDVLREFSTREPSLTKYLFKDRVDYQLDAIRRMYGILN
jgi:para-nitrobenzyl esterase